LTSSPAISCTSITILRRTAALSIRMNALISLKPSESEMKSLISAIDNALPLEPCGADAFGAPSKKNATGTCRILDICCNRAYLPQVLGSGGLDRGRSEKSKKAAAHGPQGRCRQVCRVGRRQARILVFRLRRGHRLLCYPIPR